MFTKKKEPIKNEKNFKGAMPFGNFKSSSKPSKKKSKSLLAK